MWAAHVSEDAGALPTHRSPPGRSAAPERVDDVWPSRDVPQRWPPRRALPPSPAVPSHLPPVAPLGCHVCRSNQTECGASDDGWPRRV